MWKKFKLSDLKFNRNYTLSQQIVILITSVMCLALLPTSLFTTYRVSKVIYDRISINAVSINNILCNSEEIQDGLLVQNAHIDPAIDTAMADYVNEVDNSDEAGVAIFDVYGNLRVLYNPINLPNFEESARELMETYAEVNKITWQENYAIPNKAFGFVKNANNKTIGYVVTGYSDDIFNRSTVASVTFLILMTVLGLLIGIWGAIFLAQRIKRVLFGYEPEEIARMLQERNIVLNSVREGIINVNHEGVITVVNAEAQSLLEQAGINDSKNLCGQFASKVLKRVPLNDIIKEGKTLVDASVKIGEIIFVITVVPLLDIEGRDRILGAVITFRKKAVVEEMANQLTGFKNYATALRAQTHEFMNKMHVIMGLIDMRAYDELCKYTKEIASSRQSEVSYITTRLKDITLSGFIIGKVSRSRELDIDFSLTEESELHADMDVPSVHDLILIIGNLLENAFDALQNYDGERLVNLSILDFDYEIVIVVEDSGPGISDEVLGKIYQRGFSTKGTQGHGFGLFLLKQNVDNLNGSITVETVLGEGTTFTVRLPVKKEVDENDQRIGNRG
jgi:CitB family two-component system sensor histidine kinase MalK